MNQAQVVRTSLVMLFLALVLSVNQTQNALAHEASHRIGKESTLRRPLGSIPRSPHRTLENGGKSGLPALGVSYSGTSCIETGRTTTFPPTPGGRTGGPTARRNEDHSDKRESPAEGNLAISGWPELPVRPEFGATRGIEELVRLIPPVDVSVVPQPDPVRATFAILFGEDSLSAGGLWISGDTIKAMDLLRWIAGDQSELLYMDSESRVRFRTELLFGESGAERLSDRQAGLVMAEYIASHEGLLLLTELTYGRERYLLHIGNSAPTMGEPAKVSSTLNLDINFDSRINPRRPHRQKVLSERPPKGFDSMVAVNPGARWVNVRSRRALPLESIVLHELAEAHAKVALGLDYLPMDGRPGAHDLAVECEVRFASQRPFSGTQLTSSGWIRVLAAEEQ